MPNAVKRIFAILDGCAAKTNFLAEDFEKHEGKDLLEDFLRKVSEKGGTDFIKDFGFDLSSQKFTIAWVLFKLSGIFGAIFSLFLLILPCQKIHRRCLKKNQNKQTELNNNLTYTYQLLSYFTTLTTISKRCYFLIY